MKILAFADIHGSLTALENIKKLVEKEKPDILIDCGDISVFENDLEYLISRLDKFKIKCLMIHGNHEGKEFMEHACSKYKNIIFLHNKTYRDGNYFFYGFGGGGFALNDKKFEKEADKQMKNKRMNDILVLITHGPPHKTKLDELWGESAGNKSINRVINKYKPVIALSGHLHENSGKQDKIGRTKVINPGPYGKIIVI